VDFSSLSLPAALARKDTGRRNECYDGLLFPPERFQIAIRRRRRKGIFKNFCDNIVARMSVAVGPIAGRLLLVPLRGNPPWLDVLTNET
jgi:hypothetical protein